MWKNVLYVLGTAGIFYLAVLYKSRGLMAVCFTAAILPLFFLCILSYMRKRLECALLFCPYPIENTADYQVGLRVENKSSVYFPRVQVKLEVLNTATGKKQRVKAMGKVSAGETAELSGRLKEPEFGLWQARCSYIRCYEWMGLLHLRTKVQDKKQVMVFPAVYATNIKIGIRTRLFLSDGEQYHPQISGDDPSETLKLREYQKGDRPSRIHWKLSAKSETLIVAEMSMPVGCNVAIFLDAEPSAMGKKESRVYWEILHSLSQELLAQECAHSLIWRDERYQEQLCRKDIRGTEDLMDFWCEIFPGKMEKGANPETYGKAFAGETYASQLVLNHRLELYCNHKLEVGIKPERVKEQLAELELLL